MTNLTFARTALGNQTGTLETLGTRSRQTLLGQLHRRPVACVLVGVAVLSVLLLALAQPQLLPIASLVFFDGIVPLVPGEAALLAQAPAALAGGWSTLIGLATVAAVAAFFGDATTYVLGRWVGTERFAWQRRPRVARLLARTGAELDRRGLPLIVSARLLPGWRVAITFMAGATGLAWPRFLLASALGATVWAGYLLGIGATIGAVTGGGPIVVAILSLATTAALAQMLRWLRRRLRASRPAWLGSHRSVSGCCEFA